MIPKEGRETIFFFLIPIFILLIAVIFEFVMINVQERRIANANEYILTNVLTTNVTDLHERVERLYDEKNIDTERLEVNEIDGYVYIHNLHRYDSFFGRVLGIGHYTVQISIRGHEDNGEIIIEEVDLDDFPFPRGIDDNLTQN